MRFWCLFHQLPGSQQLSASVCPSARPHDILSNVDLESTLWMRLIGYSSTIESDYFSELKEWTTLLKFSWRYILVSRGPSTSPVPDIELSEKFLCQFVKTVENIRFQFQTDPHILSIPHVNSASFIQIQPITISVLDSAVSHMNSSFYILDILPIKLIDEVFSTGSPVISQIFKILWSLFHLFPLLLCTDC